MAIQYRLRYGPVYSAWRDSGMRYRRESYHIIAEEYSRAHSASPKAVRPSHQSLELEHAPNARQISRWASALRKCVPEIVDRSQARAEARALDEFRIEWQVICIERAPEERPAAVNEHVAEVAHRIAEARAPVDDAREPASSRADEHVIHLEVVVNESWWSSIG